MLLVNFHQEVQVGEGAVLTKHGEDIKPPVGFGKGRTSVLGKDGGEEPDLMVAGSPSFPPSRNMRDHLPVPHVHPANGLQRLHVKPLPPHAAGGVNLHEPTAEDAVPDVEIRDGSGWLRG